MTEQQIKEQIKSAEALAEKAKINFNDLLSKIDNVEMKKSKEALENIDFNDASTVVNAHKIIGRDLENFLKNDKSSTK